MDQDLQLIVNVALTSNNYKLVSDLILKALENNKYKDIIDSNLHVTFANWLALAGEWDAINAMLPPASNIFETSGWLKSLISRRPENANGMPIPWYTYSAIDFIEPRIKPEWRTFEWGSGFSTLWWETRVAQVHSVESNDAWFAEIHGRVRSNVLMELHNDDESYVSSIEHSPYAPFNVIVVDGDHRNACARHAVKFIAQDGIIIFDNADGKQFNDGVEFLQEAGWMRIDFFGLIPCYMYKNCTSIFFRDAAFLRNVVPPSEMNLSTGISCFQRSGV